MDVMILILPGIVVLGIFLIGTFLYLGREANNTVKKEEEKDPVTNPKDFYLTFSLFESKIRKRIKKYNPFSSNQPMSNMVKFLCMCGEIPEDVKDKLLIIITFRNTSMNVSSMDLIRQRDFDKFLKALKDCDSQLNF